MMFEATYVFLWVAVVLQALFICFLVRELSELRHLTQSGQQPVTNGLPVGSNAPEFAALDLRSGESVQSSSFLGHQTVLLLLTPDCGECRRLVTQLTMLSESIARRLVVYCHGANRRCQNVMTKVPAFVTVIVDEETDVTTAYQLRGFPAMIGLDEQWRIVGYRYPYQIDDVATFLSHPAQTWDVGARSERATLEFESDTGQTAARPL